MRLILVPAAAVGFLGLMVQLARTVRDDGYGHRPALRSHLGDGQDPA